MNGDANRGSSTASPADEYKMLLRLQIAAGIGCFFILTYAIQFFQTGSVIRVASAGVLIAGASLFVGFVLGFIFCIPRTAKPTETVAASSSSQPRGGADSTPHSSAVAFSAVETNTNLVDISDWLTKILVGVGLVELNKIPHFLRLLSVFLGAGLRADVKGPYVESSQAFALGVVLYFFATGFLIGYLWTRLYFQSALSRLTDYVRRVDQAWFDATEAEALMQENQLRAAMGVVDQALRVNPANAKALFIKARILKRLAQAIDKPGDKDLLKEAIDYVTQAARLLPNRAAALYNLACYQALLGADKSEVLANLRQAIKLNPRLRDEAVKDEDLISLWQDTDFKELTKTDPVVDTKPGSIVDTKAEPKADTKPDVVVDAKPESTADTKPEPIVDAKPQPNVDPMPGPHTD